MHLFPKYPADLKPVVYSDSVNEEHYAEGVVHFCSTTDTGTKFRVHFIPSLQA